MWGVLNFGESGLTLILDLFLGIFMFFVAGTDSLSEVVNLGTLLNRRMGV